MYDLGNVLEEELFITNKESKELLANLEDEVTSMKELEG